MVLRTLGALWCRQKTDTAHFCSSLLECSEAGEPAPHERVRDSRPAGQGPRQQGRRHGAQEGLQTPPALPRSGPGGQPQSPGCRSRAGSGTLAAMSVLTFSSPFPVEVTGVLHNKRASWSHDHCCSEGPLLLLIWCQGQRSQEVMSTDCNPTQSFEWGTA